MLLVAESDIPSVILFIFSVLSRLNWAVMYTQWGVYKRDNVDDFLELIEHTYEPNLNVSSRVYS